MTFFCTIFLQHTLVAVYTLKHKKREFAFIYVLFIAFGIYGVYNCFLFSVISFILIISTTLITTARLAKII